MIDIDTSLLAASVNGCRAFRDICNEPCTIRGPEGHITGIEHYTKSQRELMFSTPWRVNTSTKIISKGRVRYSRVSGVMSSDNRYKTFLNDKDRADLTKKLKKDIIKEAKRQFLDNGYRSTNNRSITAALGYDKKDQKVRYYFKNKANLYKEIFGEYYAE